MILYNNIRIFIYRVGGKYYFIYRPPTPPSIPFGTRRFLSFQHSILCFNFLPLFPIDYSNPTPCPFVRCFEKSFHICKSKVFHPSSHILLVFPFSFCITNAFISISKLSDFISHLDYRLLIYSDSAFAEYHAVSRPRELDPKSLSEPYVNFSAHTAPIIQPMAVSQISSAQTDSYHILLFLLTSIPPFFLSFDSYIFF